MQVDTRATNVPLNKDFFAQADRRIHFMLSRFALMIHDVSVVLTDVNGPRGGDDIDCRVTIRAIDGWTITLSDVDAKPGRALARAVRRARRVFTRELARRRQRAAS